jgi:uncharacterized protein
LPRARTASRAAGRRPEDITCGIAVMAKASAPGRTKTRLVPPLTFEEAAAFNTAFLQDVAGNLLDAGRTVPIKPYMAFGPPGSGAFFARHLPPSIGRFEAWFPDFGECLFAAIDTLLRQGHGAAMVLNADSPTLPSSLLVRAAELLAQPGDRAVLGPASDGGYYLLGLKQAHRRMFEDIDWSTERVAAQTIARVEELGLPLHVLPTWYDVDDIEALRRLRLEVHQRLAFEPELPPGAAPATAALLARLLAETDLAARLGVAGPVHQERVAV